MTTTKPIKPPPPSTKPNPQQAPDPTSYFARMKTEGVISTGCALLDCVLGGGWAIGRIANIVGDKSTGKTLLAIEAATNFVLTNPTGEIRYCEVEAAFDVPYAQALGLPVERVKFADGVFTVEDFFADLGKFATKRTTPGLYIVDSLDALSDQKELESEMGEGSYGTQKAKKMGELFRRLVQQLESSNVTLIIISQERDNIGVTFGKKSTRSGGRALDFYASQVLWLAPRGALKKSVKGIERSYGISCRAKCEKNKIGLPLRECEFPIIFGFGVDDLRAGLDWLIEVKQLDAIGFTEEDAEKLLKGLERLTPAQYQEYRNIVNQAVVKVWYEVEAGFVSVRKKY